MYAHPTTTVSVLRGETTDSLGDPVAADTVVAADVPASILEQRRRVYVQAENRSQQVLFYTGRLPADTDVRILDRLLDAAGSVFFVESVSRVGSPVQMNDLRLDLRKAS